MLLYSHSCAGLWRVFICFVFPGRSCAFRLDAHGFFAHLMNSNGRFEFKDWCLRSWGGEQWVVSAEASHTDDSISCWGIPQNSLIYREMWLNSFILVFMHSLFFTWNLLQQRLWAGGLKCNIQPPWLLWFKLNENKMGLCRCVIHFHHSDSIICTNNPIHMHACA